MFDSARAEAYPAADGMLAIGREGFHPRRDHLGRLWSLSEIMRVFQPQLLTMLSCLLEGLLVADRAGNDILDTLATLGLAHAAADRNPRDAESVSRMACESICAYIPLVNGLGFVASGATLQKIAALGDGATPDYGRLTELMGELKERLHDECGRTIFFSMDQRESTYYKTPLVGWEELIKRFPTIGDDVEESSKCMALSRYPAAVFHSVQVVEFGLIELGTFIGVTDPLSGWTAVSSRLKNIIKTDYKARTDFERDNFPFIEQVQGTVEALKNAWRNKISHAHGKLVVMTANFSPEVAEEILMATRAFMRRLADGLPTIPPSVLVAP